MTILNELKTASYRGIEFFYQSSTESGGFKFAEHIYPDSDNIIIEQLGKVPRRFSFECRVLFENRDAFDNALNTEGTGTLSHPMYGNFPVKVTSVSKRDSIDDLGLYDYSIEFVIEEGSINPVDAGVTTTVINSAKDVVKVAVFNFLSNEIIPPIALAGATASINLQSSATFLSFQSLVGDLNRVSQSFEDAIIRVVNDENEQFNDDLRKFINNTGLIITTNEIGAAINELFTSYEIVGATPEDQFKLSQELFDFGEDNGPVINTPTENNNTFTVDIAMQMDALALAYNSATQITYGNTDELQSTI